MSLFEVYPLYDVKPVKAKGSYVYDEKGQEFLDFYGGHGVISVGHSHPYYTAKVKEQLDKIGFYSNSIQNDLQQELAQKLLDISNCKNYELFLCNSGAEANENALKLASFKTGRSKVIAFKKAFHGRTSAAVAVTDNSNIQAVINQGIEVAFLELNDLVAVEHQLKGGDICAVIIEGIQGVGGLDEGTTEFFKGLEHLCNQFNAVLILDEIQSGYVRTGQFFAFQKHQIKPDLISMAKGMGNGFPIGGVLIGEKFKSKYGMLGTTFGGNHLACAAAIAVLDIIKQESLVDQVNQMHQYLMGELANISEIKQVKGRGLMLGLLFDFEIASLRKSLIFNHQIFTGGSANKNLLRILPPLNITKKEVDEFIEALKKALKE